MARAGSMEVEDYETGRFISCEVVTVQSKLRHLCYFIPRTSRDFFSFVCGLLDQKRMFWAA